MFPFSPDCFLAQRSSLNESQFLPWYGALWQKDLFRSRVQELYRTEFLPEVEHLMSDTIPELTERLQTATEMNRIRWYDVGDTETSIAELKDYLEKHVAFLNSAWIDGVSYHTLTLKRWPGDVYFYYCVPDGMACPELPTPEDFGGEGEIWFREDNGEIFDKGEPVEADLTLTAYEP